ncbi:MAG: portal protein, partial [Flammeovirgaceae bacterium]
VNQLEMYVGTYFSREYIKRDILRMSDSQINEMKEQIDKEKKSGVIPKTTQLEFETSPRGLDLKPTGVSVVRLEYQGRKI